MKHFIACLVGISVIAVAAIAVGNARDADGSRMQARSHTLGDRATDRLAPPGDIVDWRYIRVKKAGNVSFALKASPADVPVSLQVTSAVGKNVMKRKTEKGVIKASRKLEPGLYYISVGARDAVNYELVIQ